jgi:hypothetical protein
MDLTRLVGDVKTILSVVKGKGGSAWDALKAAGDILSQVGSWGATNPLSFTPIPHHEESAATYLEHLVSQHEAGQLTPAGVNWSGLVGAVLALLPVLQQVLGGLHG